jgi:chitinase
VLKLASLFILISTFCPAAEIIGYIFPQNSVLKPSDIAAEKLTRINYAFANLKDGKVVEGFAHDAENFAVLNGLKGRNPNLKILISVGGWSWSGAFSDAALTKASRKVFVDSAIAFVEHYNLDGLDIDWEYPGMVGAGNVFRPEDKQNYTALLGDLRKAFNREGARLHKRLYTSVATGSDAGFIAHTEMSKVAKEVDTVNLMCYDYYEHSDDKIAGHHSPLFRNPADPKKVSSDASVELYRKAGVPARKLILGVPFYGHAWTSDGLYKSAVGANIPTDYHDITSTMTAANGYQRYWDSTASVPYLYNSKTRLFVSYEDPESLTLKCKYVRKHKLGGIMFWEYTGDLNGALLTAIYSGLK